MVSHKSQQKMQHVMVHDSSLLKADELGAALVNSLEGLEMAVKSFSSQCCINSAIITCNVSMPVSQQPHWI
jgi:hypothetical protein